MITDKRNKALIRAFAPFVSGKYGRPLKRSQWRLGQEWAQFEQIIKDALVDCGLHPVSQPDIRRFDNYCGDYVIKIFSHNNKMRAPEADLFYMQMHHKRLFTLDKFGWGAKHSLSRSVDYEASIFEEAGQLVELDLEEMIFDLKSGETKHAQTTRKGKKKIKADYIFVPLQTPRDEVIVEHSPCSVVEFVGVVTKAAMVAKRNVVFKIHPYARDNLAIRMAVTYAEATSKYVASCNDHVTDLILGSDAVVCQNSGVGFEALLLGKPVFTLGHCDYAQATIKGNLDDPNILVSFLDSPERPANVRQFINWYMRSVGLFMRRNGENQEILKTRIAEKILAAVQ